MLSLVVETVPPVPTLCLVLALLIYFPLCRLTANRVPKLQLPVFEVQDDVVRTIEEGHQKVSSSSTLHFIRLTHIQYPDSPFVLSLVGMEMVILPRSSIDVIKSLPETDVSIKCVRPHGYMNST